MDADRCSVCGMENPAEEAFCEGCGRPLRGLTPRQEADHIAYLLTEAPKWRSLGWLPDPGLANMARFYRLKRLRLLGREPEPELAPPPPLRSESPAPAAPGPEPESSPQLGPFLEAHWLKLLAGLAALFIFVGMRQLLGWEWVSRLAVLLIPLLPLGLCAAFYWLGARRREADPAGAFAASATSVMLAAFSVFAINKYWLGGLIPPAPSVLLGVLSSTAMGGALLRARRDVPYLHLFLAGIAASLFAGLQALAPAGLFTSEHALLYGAAFVALGCGLLAAARFLPLGDSGGERNAVQFWAHLCVLAGLTRASLPADRGIPGAAAALMLAAACVYVLAAAWFGRPGMSYASGGLSAAAALVTLRDWDRLDWYPFAAAALTLSGAALGLSRTTGQLGGLANRRAVAEAYARISLAAAVVAGAALAARLWNALVGSAPSVTAADWPAAVALAAVCAAVYGFFAVWRRQAEWLYPACAAAAFAMTLWTNRILSAAAAPGHSMAHDLVPFAAICLLAGILMLRQPEERREFQRPLLASAYAACTAGLAVALMRGLMRAPDPWFWAGLLPYLAIAVSAAWTLRARATRDWSAAWSALATAACLICTAFAGVQLYSARPFLAGGIGLAAGGWLILLLTALAPTKAAPAPWSAAAAAGATLAGLLGGMLAISEPRLALWEAIFALTLPMTLLAAQTSQTRRDLPAAAAAVLLAVSWPRLMTMSPPAGSLFALAFAAAFGRIAWTQDRPRLAAVSLAGASLAGLAAASDPQPFPTAAIGAAGLFAGAGLAAASSLRWRMRSFGFTAALMAAAAAWLCLYRLAGIPEAWIPAAMIPPLSALYAAAWRRGRQTESPLAQPARWVAVGVSVASVSASLAAGIALGGEYARAAAPTLWTVGALYTLRAVRLPSVAWTALAASTLSISTGWQMIVWGWTPAQWACGVAVVGAVLLAAADVVARKGQEAGLAKPLFMLSTAAAAIAGLIGFGAAPEAGQGELAVTALALAGAVFSGHCALGRGEAYAHAGFASFFLAYALFLYDRTAIGVDVLDLYLLPVGIYILTLAQLRADRDSLETTLALWWAGLLLVFLPTYIAFHYHFTHGSGPLHSALLLLECAAAIAWGIARRIRAFVLSGSLFSLAFALTLAAGAIREVWSGLFAVVLGVSLLVFVLYVSIHQQTLRRWLRGLSDRWGEWT